MGIYKELILQNCAGIVNQVLGKMHIYKVGSGKIPVTKDSVIYRWWFPETSKVVKILREWKGSDLLAGVQTREFEGTTYYALYFGKSNNGYLLLFRALPSYTYANLHLLQDCHQCSADRCHAQYILLLCTLPSSHPLCL